MLRRLFEIEVPEVHNGVVDIKAIAREAGFRSKVAVSATQPGIDPVGSCIGIRGNRIQSIVNELQGEKIDIVSWDSDPRSFIANALSPSEPVQVELLDAEQTAVVVVPDRQLSLAIGKEGQNTRLAARLTGWRLDIKGMTEWEQIREARLQAAAEAAAAKAAAVAVARAANGTAQDEASSEPEEVETLTPVAEVVAAIEQGLDIGEPTAAVDGAVPEPAVDAVAGDLDDDSILEALILDEELLTETVAEVEPAVEAVDVGLSVDDLDTFTLDDMEILDEEDGEEENLPLDLGELPILTPDAGKIRFAEDIVEDIRGGGRRGGGRARRGGGGGSRRR
jgi:transcription antitermination factor NusA-like protein